MGGRTAPVYRGGSWGAILYEPPTFKHSLPAADRVRATLLYKYCQCGFGVSHGTAAEEFKSRVACVTSAILPRSRQ